MPRAAKTGRPRRKSAMRWSAWATSHKSPSSRPLLMPKTRSWLPWSPVTRRSWRSWAGAIRSVPVLLRAIRRVPAEWRSRCCLYRPAKSSAPGIHRAGRPGRGPRALREAYGGDRRRLRADDPGGCEENGVKLMVGYRLHFEEANLKAIDLVQQGTLGEPRLFDSVFTMQVKEGDIRLNPRELGGGTALRYRGLLHQRRAEPVRCRADGSRGVQRQQRRPRFRQCEEIDQRHPPVSRAGTTGELHLQLRRPDVAPTVWSGPRASW